MEMRRAAVLVGCLYRNTPQKPDTTRVPQGCINDVSYMKNLLIGCRFQFQEENIQVLTDDTHIKPTKENIMIALKLMIDNAGPNDVLFFFFSGYGTRFGTDFVKQQAIVPLDALDGSNLITSDDLQRLVNKLPSGATLTIVADSGHSGRLIHEKPQQIITSSSQIESHNVPEIQTTSKALSPTSFMSPSTIRSQIEGATRAQSDGGILLSACQPDETAYEVVPAPDPADAFGAFTRAIKKVLDANPGPINNKNLVTESTVWLNRWNMNQQPDLYCSDENADAIFLLQP